MSDFETHEDDVAELGSVSVETKGNAVIGADPSGGRLSYFSGIVED